jgi:hypothetical protein
MSESACEEDRYGADIDGSVSLNIDGHDGEDDNVGNGGVGDVSVDGGRGGGDCGGGVGSDDRDDDAVIAMTMVEMTTQMTMTLTAGTAMAVIVEGGNDNDDVGRRADSFSDPLL